MIHINIAQFYPDLEQQKYWDFLVDHEWYSKSDLMPGEIVVEKEGEGHPQGVGAVRRIKNGKIELVEDIPGFEPPRYFSYAIRDGALPIKGYRGEFFLESKDGGLMLKYHGSFQPKLFGTNWLYKWFLVRQMKATLPVWKKAYRQYHGLEQKN